MSYLNKSRTYAKIVGTFDRYPSARYEQAGQFFNPDGSPALPAGEVAPPKPPKEEQDAPLRVSPGKVAQAQAMTDLGKDGIPESDPEEATQPVDFMTTLESDVAAVTRLNSMHWTRLRKLATENGHTWVDKPTAINDLSPLVASGTVVLED